MGGGEHGNGQHRHNDGHDPAEDGEQEADEGQRRQQVGEHGAGDQQEPEHGRDEAVGDLPDGFEHIEALANEGHGFEQSRSGGRAHQCRHGGQRRVHQAVAEGSEIGNGIAAVGDDHAVEIDELQETCRHGAATAPTRATRRRHWAAAENSMGW